MSSALCFLPSSERKRAPHSRCPRNPPKKQRAQRAQKEGAEPSLTHGPVFKLGNESILPTMKMVFLPLLKASRMRVEGVKSVRRMLGGDRWRVPSIVCYGGGHFSEPLTRDMLTITLLYGARLIGSPVTSFEVDFKVDQTLVLADTTKAAVAFGGLLSHIASTGETSVKVVREAWRSDCKPTSVDLMLVKMSVRLPGDLLLRCRKEKKQYEDELLIPAGSPVGYQRSGSPRGLPRRGPENHHPSPP